MIPWLNLPKEDLKKERLFENPKDSTKNHLQLINKFSKVIGYKINIDLAVLHTEKHHLKQKLRKQWHQNNKIFKRFKQKVKDLCTENYKTSMKEI